MATPLDIKGCRFGKLTVISLIPEDETKDKYKIRIISVKGGRIYVF